MEELSEGLKSVEVGSPKEDIVMDILDDSPEECASPDVLGDSEGRKADDGEL